MILVEEQTGKLERLEEIEDSLIEDSVITARLPEEAEFSRFFIFEIGKWNSEGKKKMLDLSRRDKNKEEKISLYHVPDDAMTVDDEGRVYIEYYLASYGERDCSQGDETYNKINPKMEALGL